MNYRPQIFAFVFGAFAALAAPAAHAQVGVNVQIGHPAWGPAVPAGAQYYYVPEIDGYYDLAARNYIVQRDGRWLPVASVPGYNPASFHPVVVDYRGRQPGRSTATTIPATGITLAQGAAPATATVTTTTGAAAGAKPAAETAEAPPNGGAFWPTRRASYPLVGTFGLPAHKFLTPIERGPNPALYLPNS